MGSRGTPPPRQTFVPPSWREGRWKCESGAGGSTVLGEGNGRKGKLFFWRQRKNGQRGRRKPGMAGVTEAKEEGVSRRKRWSVTVQPTQKVNL